MMLTWHCAVDDDSFTEPCVNQWVYSKTMVDVIIDGPRDGLLPISTQKALPGCIKTQELLHINYEEAISHPDFRTQLGLVFSGTTYTDRNRLFFQLTHR
jgi:hypothetical protein